MTALPAPAAIDCVTQAQAEIIAKNAAAWYGNFSIFWKAAILLAFAYAMFDFCDRRLRVFDKFADWLAARLLAQPAEKHENAQQDEKHDQPAETGGRHDNRDG